MLRIASRRQLLQNVVPRVCQTSSQRRTFFGMGEILGVLTNPAETLRQLNESREMLKKAKEDMELSNEAKKIPPKHTFSRLPGFHGRKVEQAMLRRILSNVPKMTIIFGATSVGKTALLREVLATDDFFVIKFDLRISGFADLRSLYIVLCEQFERFFEEMHDEEMDKNKLTFKHLKLELLKRDEAEANHREVTVADLASLMESLQSCLLKYWEYEPKEVEEEDGQSESNEKAKASTQDANASSASDSRKIDVGETPAQSGSQSHEKPSSKPDNDADPAKVFKKRPIVFFMDEAHKLPALVDDQLSLKVFLDTLLVLTKQDRLCHVILSTSDSFFHHFLRGINVGHHAQILTIGDCTKEETRTYFNEQVLPSVPEKLRGKLSFDDLYGVFGGKLTHINDYVSSWTTANGEMSVYESAIFVQAYTLLQFHLTRSKFETFSPLSTATAGTSTEDDGAKFSPDELRHVMKTMIKRPYSRPYFQLCREIGTAQVDSMIKTRILELRWTRTVSPEDTAAEDVWTNDGIQRPVVLPMTRIIRRAMEVVLKEEEEMDHSSDISRKANKKHDKPRTSS